MRAVQQIASTVSNGPHFKQCANSVPRRDSHADSNTVGTLGSQPAEARVTPVGGSVRFAAITDIHHYPTGRLAPEIAFWKLSEHALDNATDFHQILSTGQYGFGINLGDSIEDSGHHPDGRNIDHHNISEVVSKLKQETPLYHVIGNHDTVNLTPEAITEITGCRPYYSFDEGAFHFIVLHSVANKYEPADTVIPTAQLDWLAADLADNTTRPTVVFLHHALSERSVDGNHWFEPNPEQAFVKNRQAVRALFKASGNICLVMNGHLHDNNLYRDPDDETIYVTLQSATENIGRAKPANAWADVQLSQTGAVISVSGNDPIQHTVIFPERIQDLISKQSTEAMAAH